MMVKAPKTIHSLMWLCKDVFIVLETKNLCLGYEHVVSSPNQYKGPKDIVSLPQI